jgi:aspartyl-tRNA(Asn)/glutamyl-tRNA(Gln) amidotransferase subunit A
MAEETAFVPATQLLAQYRKRQLSPVEVIECTLQRLETYESAVNAFVLFDPATAMAMARASEARWRNGEPAGLLDGVPVAIKDTVLTRGWPRLLGSRTIDPNQDWAEDSPVVARLRAEGAVFFGKTTTPEFGWKPLTDSPLTGVTRNPWDLQRTPGGSSGGSAAAVLAGVCPLAVGTDAGGSIRIPAAFCGVVGYKPTFGKVAVYPPSVFGDVAHVGPMARTVEDAALMLDAIKGPDSRDWHSLPDDRIAYRERVHEGSPENSLRGKRIALSLTLGLADPAPAVRAAIERAAQVCTALGAVVEPADPFPQSPKPIFEALALAAFWALLRAQPEEAVAVMDPGLVAVCRAGEAVTQEQYVEAVTARAALGQALRLFFDRFDLLLAPTMPIAAAYADPRDDGLPNPNNFRDWTPYTSPFNLTKNPCCSIPCGFHDGLPIGLQVIGPLFEDLAVLQACGAYQQTVGAALPSPELIGCLDRIAAPASASVAAKRWTKQS